MSTAPAPWSVAVTTIGMSTWSPSYWRWRSSHEVRKLRGWTIDMSTAVLTPAMVGVASVGDSRSQRKDGVPLGTIRWKSMEVPAVSRRA